MNDNHPIAREELMAYLDGELSPDLAARAAGHLEHCRECQDIAADLQGVSRRLMAWSVESAGARITEVMSAALEEPRKESKSNVPWFEVGLGSGCSVRCCVGLQNCRADEDVSEIRRPTAA